jgi:hypothetical protein
MSSKTWRLELESPSATLPPAKWAVICTDEQFWDSRLHVWRRANASIRHLGPAMSIRMDRDNYEFLAEISKEERTDL